MAKGAHRALLAGAIAKLPQEREYLRQYPELYRDMMGLTISEVLHVANSECTPIEYSDKRKCWVKLPHTTVLYRMGKRFTQFEARVLPGGMYELVKRRMGNGQAKK